MTEEWRPYPDCLCHWVSDRGRVKTIVFDDRLLPRPMLVEPREQHDGYYSIRLHKKGFSLHRLVMFVFVGPCPEGVCVNHIDANKGNNSLGNLEYVTPRENALHARRLGLIPKPGHARPRPKRKEVRGRQHGPRNPKAREWWLKQIRESEEATKETKC